MAMLIQSSSSSNILLFHSSQTAREVLGNTFRGVVYFRGESRSLLTERGWIMSLNCSSKKVGTSCETSFNSSSMKEEKLKYLRDKKLVPDSDPSSLKDVGPIYYLFYPSATVTENHILGSSQLGMVCLSKRTLNLSVLSLFLFGFSPNFCSAISSQGLELERYTDSKEGFTLLKPSSWIKVDKAGATVLFEDVNKRSNNVGVVVNPVRLTSLGEFGTPQFVADKLIQAEKRKESTKEAAVIGVAERSGEGGLQVYEFEYEVDSSRGGMKRIFSAAFVASKKLYILNISHSDKPESPLDSQTRMMLEQVLHSFDAAPPFSSPYPSHYKY